MPLELGLQCCDASNYLALGCACALHAPGCWSPLRPIGATWYFSLPHRLGLGPGSLIFFNALCLAASAACATAGLAALRPDSTRLSRRVLAFVCLAIPALLVGKSITNSLSDIPAAALAMISMWLSTLGSATRRSWYYAASGLALGLAAITRAFYLYPAIAGLVAVAALAAFGRIRRSAAGLAAGMFLLPVALQYGMTHAHTGRWGFIDPAQEAAAEQEHFGNALYGYDTVLTVDSFHEDYEARECFSGKDVMSDAIRKRDVSALACLWAHRQWFYLGSYVPDGRTYLTDAGERRFSRAYLGLNVIALLGGLAWVLTRARRAMLLASPLAVLAAIWGEASFILPETRFMLVFLVVSWTLAAAALSDLFEWLFFRSLPRSEIRAPASEAARARSAWLSPDRLRAGAVLLVTPLVQGAVLDSPLTREDLRYVYESDALGSSHLGGSCNGHFCSGFRFVVDVLHWLFGIHASAFFGAMLFVHALTAVLIYRIAANLGASGWLAAAGAALWGAAPMLQETLLRFASFAEVFALTALAWALLELAPAAREGCVPRTSALIRANAALILGTSAGLDGAVSAIAFPVGVYLLVPSASAARRAATFTLPSALAALASLAIFSHRGSSPAPHGPAAALGGLHSASDLLGSALVLGAAAACVWGLARHGDARRRTIAAFLWFAVTTYGAARMGSGAGQGWRAPHLYAASAAFVLGAVVAIDDVLSRARWPAKRPARVLAACLAAAWAIACAAAARSSHRTAVARDEGAFDANAIAIGWLSHLLSRFPPGATLYVSNDVVAPSVAFADSYAPADDFPGIGAEWIATWGTSAMHGSHVRFVESDLRILESIRHGSTEAVSSTFVSIEDMQRDHGTMLTATSFAPPEIAAFLRAPESEPRSADTHEWAKSIRTWLESAAVLGAFPKGQAPLGEVCSARALVKQTR